MLALDAPSIRYAVAPELTTWKVCLMGIVVVVVLVVVVVYGIVLPAMVLNSLRHEPRDATALSITVFEQGEK